MKTIIVGLGNRSFSDDGVGIEIARKIERSLPDKKATVVEASSAGLDILDIVADYDKAVIIDAVQTQCSKPGTIHRFKIEEIDCSNNEVSPHKLDFISTLNLGKRLGLTLPREIIIYGIEAVDINEPKEECTPLVNEAASLCAKQIIAELQFESKL